MYESDRDAWKTLLSNPTPGKQHGWRANSARRWCRKRRLGSPRKRLQPSGRPPKTGSWMPARGRINLPRLIRPSCALDGCGRRSVAPAVAVPAGPVVPFEILARRTRPRRVRLGVLSYSGDPNKPPRPFLLFSSRNDTFPRDVGTRIHATPRYHRPIYRQWPNNAGSPVQLFKSPRGDTVLYGKETGRW